MKLNTLVLSSILSAAALSASNAVAATLIYRNTFDNASPTVSAPANGTGTLAAVNGGGSAATSFTATGGIQGGAYNGVPQGYNNSTLNGGEATTAGAGGAALSLPDQDTTDANAVTFRQFTVSFWVKASATGGFNTANFGRLFILGANTDAAANTFALEMRSGKVDVLANNSGTGTSQAQGNTLVADTWNFVAVTYDGTSTTGFNSAAQAALTGAANNTERNAQLYEGTDTTAVTRYAVATTSTTDFNTSTGPLNLSGNTLQLANRPDLTRGFLGLVDDFRIYDGLLSPTEVEAVRQSAVPEPASLALLGVGTVAALRRRRR